MDKHTSTCKKVDPPRKKVYDISPRVMEILRMTDNLNMEEYHELLCEIAKRNPCSFEHKRTFKNLIVESLSKEAKKRKETVTSKEELTNAIGQQSNVDPRASFNSSKSSLSSASASSAVGYMPPFICRGDMIEKNDVLFFDTEKVVESTSHKQVSGDLAIVDVRGILVFWTYIKRKEVCLYNTKLTGLSADKLINGLEVNVVKDLLSNLFKGKVLYGAASRNDMISLGFKSEELTFKLEDIQDFFRDNQNQPISLARLSEHFLGENMQETKHSSVVDARITAICYRRMEKMRMDGLTRFSCEEFDSIERGNNKKRNPGWESRCTCGIGFRGKGKGKRSDFRLPTNFNISNFD